MNTHHSIPQIIQEAKWIWPEDMSWDLHNCYALFRKTFSLKAVPRVAPLFITADQSYNLYVNNKFVCRGPARGFQAHWPYDEIDVSRYLRRGRNVIAVRAYNPGSGNFQYVSHGMAGLLVAARWGETKIITNLSWKCRRQSGLSKDTVPTSLQLFCQEHIDARIEPDDWMTLGFDDKSWQPIIQTHSWNGMPWYSLEPRMIPMLAERLVRPRILLGKSTGKCSPGFRHTRDVVNTRFQENMSHTKTEGSSHHLRVPSTGSGHFRSYLIDFGKTMVGNLTLKVHEANGGEIIDTLHVETIDPKKLQPHLKIPTRSRMAFGSRLICQRGRTTHRFYHPFGFRYLILTVRDSLVAMTVDIILNWIGYPLQWRGNFKSSDSQLEKIWETCAWTQQCCSLDAYVDTPWREQAQWWGDARIQAWTTFHLAGDNRLLRRGIHCIASQTAPNGLTYGHAPTIAHTCILPDFTLIWMLTIWDDYWQTGSLEIFNSNEDRIERALGYFREQMNLKTGLVRYDPRYWLFLDWTDLFKDGYSSVYNLWLLITLEKVAVMYRLSGNLAKAGSLGHWANCLRAALRKLVNRSGFVRDGITFNGRIVRHTSIHAQTLALMARLYPPGDDALLKNGLLPFIRREINPPVRPSSYWVSYVFSVLAKYGYGREVIEYIKKDWNSMVEHGTTWECFDPEPGVMSHSHAWSAHPLFHLMQIIGGITQTAAGWKEIQFCPLFIGDEGGSTIPSPRGQISSHWQRRRGAVCVTLSLPKGVKAIVHLSGLRWQAVTGVKHWELEERL